MSKALDFVASRDDVEHGKPDPEIYHLVAPDRPNRLDICQDVTHCIACNESACI